MAPSTHTKLDRCSDHQRQLVVKAAAPSAHLDSSGPGVSRKTCSVHRACKAVQHHPLILPSMSSHASTFDLSARNPSAQSRPSQVRSLANLFPCAEPVPSKTFPHLNLYNFEKCSMVMG
ncbi:hypothetical protein RRG08_004765 [Elysia crispata]|uniref:Uncharacterized protein n=1 Tax=Elysia crispata TaxID=231223 RepID=A0AAE1AJ62_9GAST|nr:hypothetical protein RRG08_004765 [Elysia crispata]